MLAGHLDEVGFIVKSVTKDGFVKFLPLGGWWGHVVLGQRLIIKTRKGDVLGVVGSKPPHELRDEDRKKVLEIKDMYIDVGATSDWDVKKKLDIRPGDPILPDSSFTVMANPEPAARQGLGQPHRLRARRRDRARGSRARSTRTRCTRWPPCRRKSACAARRRRAFKVQPDVAFALDVGIAHDTPGTEGDEKLGGGPLVVIYDASSIPNRRLLDLVIDTAAEIKIPLQFESVERGGTDAGRIHLTGEGVPRISMGVRGALHPQPREHHRPPRLRGHGEAAGGAGEAARREDGGWLTRGLA